jgi:hypothetical protein
LSDGGFVAFYWRAFLRQQEMAGAKAVNLMLVVSK